MRCQKCGFISFDYLSECRSCGVDLTAVRRDLGLLNVKPSIPFYLGASAKEGDAPKLRMESSSGGAPLQHGQVAYDPEGTLDLYGGRTADAGRLANPPRGIQGAEPTPPPNSLAPAVGEDMDETLLVDLSDEDLKLILNETELAQIDSHTEADHGRNPSVSGTKQVERGDAIARESGDEINLDLLEDDLQSILVNLDDDKSRTK